MQRRFTARASALRAAVEERYWRLWSLRRIRAVRREQAGLLEELSSSVQGHLEAGHGSLADVQQIAVARARLDDARRFL